MNAACEVLGKDNAYNFFFRNWKIRDELEDLGRDGTMILNIY
jgi:hypothetical protein